MTNNRPMIIGTADAIALKKRMEMLESQISALLDGMNATREALGGILAAIDAIEARLEGLERNRSAISAWAEDGKSQGNNQSAVENG